MFPDQVRPPTIVSLLTVLGTESDSPQYAVQTAIPSSAAAVAEATAISGSSGTKPEATFSFEMKNAPIKTIAEWVPATKRALSDASELRQLIDSELSDDVRRAIEDLIVTGDGQGENFSGILTIVTQSVGPPANSETAIALVRKAVTKCQTVGRASPTAVLVSPADSEAIDLLQDQQDRYYSDPFGPVNFSPLWNLPRVTSEAVPEGTAVVGDFRRAILFDREEANISVGTIDQMFVRNQLAVLCEARAGFGITRPNAFCTVDFAA